MAYKYEIFVALTEHFMRIICCIDAYVCTISKVVGINKEKEICLTTYVFSI